MALKAFTQQWSGNTCRVSGVALPVGATVYAETEDDVRNGRAVSQAVAFPEQALDSGSAVALPDFTNLNRDEVVKLAEKHGMTVTARTTKGEAEDFVLAALGVTEDQQQALDSGSA